MTRLLLATLLVTSCGDDPKPPAPVLATCQPPPWTPDTPGWGTRCRTVEDCPDTGYLTTMCELSTGGYCTELSGPNFVAEGQPCANDPNSVGFTIGSYRKCLAACTSDGDCRPGYACTRGLGPTGAGRACLAIDDCETNGCNDAAATEPYYCQAGSCWVDRCVGDPCADDDFSTGSCRRLDDTRQCDCVPAEHWDPDCQRCGGIVCDAIDLGRVTSTIDVSHDTCAGDSRFDPTGKGCTGWAALGPELTFQFTLPPNTGATVTASSIDFDLAVYVLESCFDFPARTCLYGEDIFEPEVAYIANDSNHERTFVAVVDGAHVDSCGLANLIIEPAAFACTATDLGTFTGATITRTESNCAGTNTYNPGPSNCTGGNHAAGFERVYQITLPPQTSATVTMTPSGFDALLYAIPRCGDYGAADCTDGSDGTGSESIVINATANAETVYIVADSFNAYNAPCGTYELRIQ